MHLTHFWYQFRAIGTEGTGGHMIPHLLSFFVYSPLFDFFSKPLMPWSTVHPTHHPYFQTLSYAPAAISELDEHLTAHS